MARNRFVYNGANIEEIESANLNLEDSLPLDELPVDTLTAVVRDYSLETRLIESDNLLITGGGIPLVAKMDINGLKEYKYGDVVQYIHNGNLIGKFYLDNIKRIGKTKWQFNCVSGIGLLMTSIHYGGIYTGETAGYVISEIICGIIPYTIDKLIEDEKIYGWLPKSTRRDNLRDVLFAIGGRIQKDKNGDIKIVPYEEQLPYEVLQDSFYLDGGSVTEGNPATQALVTEHAYAAREADEIVTLYEGEIFGSDIITPNGNPAYGAIIDFEDPMHDLSIIGGTIIERGVNYAVVADSAYATLTGKRYTHTEKTIAKNGEYNAIPNVVSSNKCYLVNIRNSLNVANRVISFYGYAKRIEANIVLNTQKTGDYITFIDHFGYRETGYIESLNVTMSNTLKAKASIVSGFSPPVITPMYLHYKFFFSDGEFVVDDGVTSLRVVLIGGGPGGNSGGRGHPSSPGSSTSTQNKYYGDGYYYYAVQQIRYPGTSGDGGIAGKGSIGAKVYSTSINVTKGQRFQVKIGQGGMGGICVDINSSPGKDGTPSTFGDLSSNSGYPISGGYLEEITGETYAGHGSDGVAGAKGTGGKDGHSIDYAIGPNLIYKQVSYHPGFPSGPDIYYNESSGSANSSRGALILRMDRGLGGGAAAGVNGPNVVKDTTAGAAGAVPVKPEDQKKVGYGGNGGNGGGGAGGPGFSLRQGNRSESYGAYDPGPPEEQPITLGGLGSSGGKGGPGAVFVYYYSPDPKESVEGALHNGA